MGPRTNHDATRHRLQTAEAPAEARAWLSDDMFLIPYTFNLHSLSTTISTDHEQDLPLWHRGLNLFLTGGHLQHVHAASIPLRFLLDNYDRLQQRGE